MIGLTILEVVLGAVIAIAITILVEALRKPSLDLRIAEPTDRAYQNRPAAEVRFLHLRLVNKPLPRWCRWMLREPALQCHGWISFHYLDGQRVFDRTMPIRWAGSPEPTTTAFIVEAGDSRVRVIDPTRITLESRIDVQPDESELLDVAAKFDHEEECYGWSNESYFSDPVWRNPRWALPNERYLVKVQVQTAGQSVTKLFRLVNTQQQEDFRLELAHPDDVAQD